MSVGSRNLTVLGEFKPFGLVAEAFDGKPPDGVPDRYDYFLFDPEIARDRDDSVSENDFSEPSPDGDGDHEIFIRGHREDGGTTCSPNLRVSRGKKQIDFLLFNNQYGNTPISAYTFLQKVFDNAVGYLTYGHTGEVACIPLPHAITSIWPLPFGLLLQKESDENRSPYFQVSSSNTLANVRNLTRPIRGYGSNPPNLLNSMEHVARMDMSSHLILKHPLEEPQGHFAHKKRIGYMSSAVLMAIFVEERGKLNPMKDFDERVIWTSDVMPLVVSYHKARKTSMDSVASAIVPSRQFSFRRIWQGKCSQLVASKVFLATDGDGVPIICFLHIEQKGLVFVTLHVDEKNNEVLFDYKPHISWSIQAIDAAPVIVTRPRW
ncbi:Anaphase-promoting complex subunit 1 [Acorus calamus]|uniref:Anaphase-promoting complex subunit 1 n=1 Tax=Acorus calamus TaxID=4465 RepID=A0AAV9F9Q8_ACOCL|nr:Anaphase-promoting complex subunit 1 [Acorus calamus]